MTLKWPEGTTQKRRDEAYWRVSDALKEHGITYLNGVVCSIKDLREVLSFKPGNFWRGKYRLIEITAAIDTVNDFPDSLFRNRRDRMDLQFFTYLDIDEFYTDESPYAIEFLNSDPPKKRFKEPERYSGGKQIKKFLEGKKIDIDKLPDKWTYKKTCF